MSANEMDHLSNGHVGRNQMTDPDWTILSTESETVFFGRERIKEPLPLKAHCKRAFSKWFSVQNVLRRLPFLTWITSYTMADLKGDLIAGITVGMTTIPQALAYAQIAELPLEYGLYSSFMCCFVYAFLGTSKDLMLGVTAVVALLTAEAMPEGLPVEQRISYAIFLALIVGLSQILMGILRAGFLFNFISHPVLSGFTTAAAFIIVFSQLKSLLGISGGSSSETVVQQGSRYLNNLYKIKGWDVLCGMLCISCLLLLRKVKPPRKSSYGPLVTETVRLFLAARYGVVVVLATLAGYLLTKSEVTALSLTSDVDASLPVFKVPQLSWNNVTFTEHFKVIAPTLPFIVLITSMEAIAIGKALGTKYSYSIDTTQELIACGMANVVTAFVSGFPTTGSFTKSSLNAQSGVRTPMGAAFAGLFVLLSMVAFSDAFKYVPKAALGAVIIVAVLVLFDFKIFKELWRTNKQELIPLMTTIFGSLYFGLEIGFTAGLATSLVLVLFSLSQPDVRLEYERVTFTATNQPGITRKVVRVRLVPQGFIFFPAMESLKTVLSKKTFPNDDRNKVVLRTPKIFRKKTKVDKMGEVTVPLETIEESSQKLECTLVLHGHDLNRLDFTTLTSLHSVIESFQSRGYSVKLVDVAKVVLDVILPEKHLDLVAHMKSNEVASLEIPPQKMNSKTEVEEQTVRREDSFSSESMQEINVESSLARRLSAVASNLE